MTDAKDINEINTIKEYNISKIQSLIFNEKRLFNIFNSINNQITNIEEEEEEDAIENIFIISDRFHIILNSYFDDIEEIWIYDLDFYKIKDKCDCYKCSKILLYSIEKYNKEKGYDYYIKEIISFLSKVNVLDAKKCSNCIKMIDNYDNQFYCTKCIGKCLLMSIEDICAICQDENHLLGFYVYGEDCKHIFHKCCMEKCKQKCPLCNTKQNFYQI
jgi:hypothetical protein